MWKSIVERTASGEGFWEFLVSEVKLKCRLVRFWERTV